MCVSLCLFYCREKKFLKNNSPMYFVLCIHCLAINWQHATSTISYLTQHFTAIQKCINSKQMWQSSDLQKVHLSQISMPFTVDYHYINATTIYLHQDIDSSNESKIANSYVSYTQIRLQQQQKIACFNPEPFNLTQVEVKLRAMYFVRLQHFSCLTRTVCT